MGLWSRLRYRIETGPFNQIRLLCVVEPLRAANLFGSCPRLAPVVSKMTSFVECVQLNAVDALPVLPGFSLTWLDRLNRLIIFSTVIATKLGRIKLNSEVDVAAIADDSAGW